MPYGIAAQAPLFQYTFNIVELCIKINKVLS